MIIVLCLFVLLSGSFSSVLAATSAEDHSPKEGFRSMENERVSTVLSGPHQDIDSTTLEHRRALYNKISPHLEKFTNEQIEELLERATSLNSGIGEAGFVELDGQKIFVKQIPLTDRELENMYSTTNIFDLPTYYSYCVGSFGFGAWRELEIHKLTTDWVLSGQCPNFPIMYHARILKGSVWNEEQKSEFMKEPDIYVKDWGESPAIRARIEALNKATSKLVLFTEFYPETLKKWLEAQFSKGDASIEAAVKLVDRDMNTTIPFLESKGLTHFDAHGRNILTDGHRLYFADFGLAMYSGFPLSKEERAFFDRHRHYDRYFMEWMLFEEIGTLLFKEAADIKLQEYVVGKGEILSKLPFVTQFFIQHAQRWSIMSTFIGALCKNKAHTPYPMEALDTSQETAVVATE